MIMRAQNPTVMMAGTDPLNMDLFAKVGIVYFTNIITTLLSLQVMNLVYKFVMVLNEMDITIE